MIWLVVVIILDEQMRQVSLQGLENGERWKFACSVPVRVDLKKEWVKHFGKLPMNKQRGFIFKNLLTSTHGVKKPRILNTGIGDSKLVKKHMARNVAKVKKHPLKDKGACRGNEFLRRKLQPLKSKRGLIGYYVSE